MCLKGLDQTLGCLFTTVGLDAFDGQHGTSRAASDELKHGTHASVKLCTKDSDKYQEPSMEKQLTLLAALNRAISEL